MIISQKSRALNEKSAIFNSKTVKEGFDLKDINWETKMKRLQQSDQANVDGIDQELESWTQALKYRTQDSKYLFSNYLGLINKRKNILMNRTQKVVQYYNDDRKVIRYAVVLKLSNFDYGKDANNQIVFYT